MLDAQGSAHGPSSAGSSFSVASTDSSKKGYAKHFFRILVELLLVDFVLASLHSTKITAGSPKKIRSDL